MMNLNLHDSHTQDQIKGAFVTYKTVIKSGLSPRCIYQVKTNVLENKLHTIITHYAQPLGTKDES